MTGFTIDSIAVSVDLVGKIEFWPLICQFLAFGTCDFLGFHTVMPWKDLWENNPGRFSTLHSALFWTLEFPPKFRSRSGLWSYRQNSMNFSCHNSHTSRLHQLENLMKKEVFNNKLRKECLVSRRLNLTDDFNLLWRRRKKKKHLGLDE